MPRAAPLYKAEAMSLRAKTRVSVPSLRFLALSVKAVVTEHRKDH